MSPIGGFTVTVLFSLVGVLLGGASWNVANLVAGCPSVEGFVVLPAMPDPCFGSATLGFASSTGTAVSFEVSDKAGHVVMSGDCPGFAPGQYEFQLSGLEPGLYVCTLEGESLTSTDTLTVSSRK
jgi:hypothetical protein